MLYFPQVHGRVSDIWRSYICQKILWHVGSRLAFVSPGVDQIRNYHDPLADMQSETPLYERAPALVEFLASWVPEGYNLPNLYLDLMIEIYERGYIELDDINLAREWIQALHKIGYNFPSKGMDP
jgi:hypothetical protein